MKLAITALTLVAAFALTSCGSSAEDAVTGHTNVEACLAVNHLLTTGRDEDTVPPDIAAIVDDSPLRDTWKAYYRALILWSNTGAGTPNQEAIQGDMNKAADTLRARCAKSKVDLAESDEQYFLPSY